jgi:hypothetical protein
MDSVLTGKLEREIADLDSFDRFFPNQDTLSKGGFGNLIALPLQKAARAQNHSLFLDPGMAPYPDQWQYLASIQRVTENRNTTGYNGTFAANDRSSSGGSDLH